MDERECIRELIRTAESDIEVALVLHGFCRSQNRMCAQSLFFL